MVMFFFWIGLFLQLYLFYLGTKGMCKTMLFLHFVPVDRVSTFQEFVGGKGMLLCFVFPENKPVDTA
jgi:hypothetical protein